MVGRLGRFRRPLYWVQNMLSCVVLDLVAIVT